MEHNDVVILNLDKPRVLRLGHKALKRLSAMTGLSLSELMNRVDDWDIVWKICFCALRVEDESLTEDQLDRLLDPLPPMEIMEKVGKAIAVAFPHDDDEEGGEDPQTAAGTGAKA